MKKALFLAVGCVNSWEATRGPQEAREAMTEACVVSRDAGQQATSVRFGQTRCYS